MLYIAVDDIKYSTVGALFSVTYSVPIDEIGYLHALHSALEGLNMTATPITTDKAERSDQ